LLRERLVSWKDKKHPIEGQTSLGKGKSKGKGQVLDIVLLHDGHMLRSALKSRKWQLIGMS